ncbi:unnamed protein product [Alternaria burnsii]|nr:unnamed protein product [Alternaria burnsii]
MSDTRPKKKRRGGPRSRTGDEPNNDAMNDAPLLVDVFRTRMNDLDLPGDSLLGQNYIPVTGITPPGPTETNGRKKIRLTPESAFLLQAYVRTVATWMDIFDHTLRSEDYRRHFLGLTILIKSRHVTAQSSGTDLANFWIYVRHEIVVAMASEQPLILNPAEWEVSWIEGETREDVLGNHVLWILARVINLIFGPDGRSAAGKEQRQNFLHEIEMWRRGLSDTFVGIGYGDKDTDGFRKVYFPVAAAAAAAFCAYMRPELQDEAYIPLIQEQAMRITDIAISDFPPALMVFSTHGLFYAAKHIHGISRKARIWNILNEVERQTGYNTGTTVRLLQTLVEEDAQRRSGSIP